MSRQSSPRRYSWVSNMNINEALKGHASTLSPLRMRRNPLAQPLPDYRSNNSSVSEVQTYNVRNRSPSPNRRRRSLSPRSRRSFSSRSRSASPVGRSSRSVSPVMSKAEKMAKKTAERTRKEALKRIATNEALGKKTAEKIIKSVLDTAVKNNKARQKLQNQRLKALERWNKSEPRREKAQTAALKSNLTYFTKMSSAAADEREALIRRLASRPRHLDVARMGAYRYMNDPAKREKAMAANAKARVNAVRLRYGSTSDSDLRRKVREMNDRQKYLNGVSSVRGRRSLEQRQKIHNLKNTATLKSLYSRLQQKGLIK